MKHHVRMQTPILYSACCAMACGALARPLAWAPPKLEKPVTVKVTDARRSLKLDQAKDYIVELPKDRPLHGQLSIWGGRNVVVIGGEILATPADKRAVYLQQNTGTMHFEGVLIRGENPGDLKEGFNFNHRQTNCIVQIQNVRVEKVHGSRAGHHADLIQTWAGPAELRIDRFTGFTQYQGMFLLPNQHFPAAKGGFPPKKWVFKNINIVGDEDSAYMLWVPGPDGQFPMEIEDVWVQPRKNARGNRDAYLWPKPKQAGDHFWDDVKEGIPPGGDFVPEGVAGRNYVSPGYEQPKTTKKKRR